MGLQSFVDHVFLQVDMNDFQLLTVLGRGAYGVVCSAQNNISGDYCAIKKIENVFEDISFSKRTLRELRTRASPLPPVLRWSCQMRGRQPNAPFQAQPFVTLHCVVFHAPF